MRGRWALFAALLCFAESAALAQANLDGEWNWLPHEEQPDPAIGEFDGLPINAAQETDLSKWSPEPCQTDAPLAPPVKGGEGG